MVTLYNQPLIINNVIELPILPSARFQVWTEPSCERASAFVSPDMSRMSATVAGVAELDGMEHVKAWPPS